MASRPREHRLHCRVPKPPGVLSSDEILVGLAIPRVKHGELTTKQLTNLCAISTFTVPAILSTPRELSFLSTTTQFQTITTDTCVYSFVGTDNVDIHNASTDELPSCITGWDVMHVGVIEGRFLPKVAPTCDLASLDVAVYEAERGKPRAWAPLAVALMNNTMEIRYANYVKNHVETLQTRNGVTGEEKEKAKWKALRGIFEGLVEAHFEYGGKNFGAECFEFAEGEELGLIGWLAAATGIQV